MNSIEKILSFFSFRTAIPSMNLGLLLLGMTVLSSCSGNRANAKPELAAASAGVPVTVASVAQKTVPVEVNAIGNVEVYSTVSVKALVSGDSQRSISRKARRSTKETFFPDRSSPFRICATAC